jgi:Na+-transporting NADH:ubiquinone oxidoreductase subunit NqrE
MDRISLVSLLVFPKGGLQGVTWIDVNAVEGFPFRCVRLVFSQITEEGEIILTIHLSFLLLLSNVFYLNVARLIIRVILERELLALRRGGERGRASEHLVMSIRR